jgi:hypothetical protein
VSLADDRDPRLDERGWADRLVGDEDLWPGEDRLRLNSDLARTVWGAVLCNYMARKDGGVRSINQCAGRLGWFHLRLTLQECRDLFASCVDEGLIELASDLRKPASDADEDAVYRRTDKGKKLKAPLGAGATDTIKRAPAVVARTFKLANLLLGAAALSVLAAAAGPVFKALKIPVDVDAAVSQVLLLGTGWLLTVAFVVGAYSDEKALRVCAKAWPRMKHYRPKRYKHATARLRTPLPFAVLVWATVAALWGGAEILLSARTPPDSVPAGWKTAAAVVAIATLLGLAVLWVRSRRLRKAYKEEYKSRRPPFRPSGTGPDGDEPWTARARRVFWLTVRRR